MQELLALCHRGAHLPVLRRREGALEVDRRRVPQEHLAHVRSDADFHAGRLSSAAGGADRGPREAAQRGDSGRDLRLSGVCVLRAGRAGDGLHVRLCAAARFERLARELARAGRQRSGADLHLYRPAAGVNQSLCTALDKLIPYITISYFFGAAAPCYNKKLDKISPLEKECYTT